MVLLVLQAFYSRLFSLIPPEILPALREDFFPFAWFSKISCCFAMEIKSTVVVVPGFSTGFYQESRVRLYPGMLRKVNCLRDAEGEIIEGVRVAQ